MNRIILYIEYRVYVDILSEGALARDIVIWSGFASKYHRLFCHRLIHSDPVTSRVPSVAGSVPRTRSCRRGLVAVYSSMNRKYAALFTAVELPMHAYSSPSPYFWIRYVYPCCRVFIHWPAVGYCPRLPVFKPTSSTDEPHRMLSPLIQYSRQHWSPAVPAPEYWLKKSWCE